MASVPGLITLRRRVRYEMLDRRPGSPSARGYLWATRTFGTIRVRLDQLLLGTEPAFLTGAQYARHTGDLLRPSRPLSSSAQVQLLQRYLEVGDEVLEPAAFRETEYYRNAMLCIDVTGQYKDARTEEELREVARKFIARFRGAPEAHDPADLPEGYSLPGTPPKVRAIRDSSYYEIADGYHSLAIEYVRGAAETRVRVLDEPPVHTPVQELLLSTLWARGKPELYQPIDAPEVSEWPLIRRCHDRMGMIRRFLEQQKLHGDGKRSSIDIACNYGWFVNEFRRLGFDAHGIELDGVGVQLGHLWYGLGPENTERAEAVSHLRKAVTAGTKFDVTTCFSLLHHFVLGRGEVSAEELLGMIDAITSEVFIFDTGEEREDWFREELAGWNPDYIERWIRENTSFTQVFRLGRDSDDVGEFAGNYGRTLFACMR